MANPLISHLEKDKLITEIKNKSESGIPTFYISPAWKLINNQVNSVQDAMIVMSKSWLIGFTEVQGSFFLVNKDPQQLVHAFEFTQKLDVIVVEAIAQILQVNIIHNKTYFSVVATGSQKIQYIIKYYFKKMKGMKALEYRIWARSFTKKKKDFEYLSHIKNLMNNIRYIRLCKSFKN